MASIRIRNGRWQARVRRHGYPIVAQTFISRSDAERWARSVEAAMDRGTFVDVTEAGRTTLGDLVERYMREVSPTMRSAHDDLIRLKALQRHSICKLSMTALSAARVAAFRDERLRSVQPATVIRELAYLSSIINHARREWGINIANPVALVRKPVAPQGRERVLDEQEEAKLLAALEPVGRRSRWLKPLVVLALETGMRRGELLSLRWERVDLTRRVARLLITKNGHSRTVPLSSQAVEVLSRLPRHISGVVFPMTPYATAAAFEKAVRRAGIEDLRFHDLRHTAITRLAQRLPNVIELAAVTGHRSLKMLQRYYHPSASELARKLG